MTEAPEYIPSTRSVEASDPETERIAKVREILKGNEGLRDLAERLYDMRDFLLVVDQKEKERQFDRKMAAQAEMVKELARVSWSESNVRAIADIKDVIFDSEVDRAMKEDPKRIGVKIWWRSMIGESAFKRVWDRTGEYLADNSEMTTVNDARLDKAGVDFHARMDIPGHETPNGEPVDIFIQVKTTTNRDFPVGEIDIVNLKGDGVEDKHRAILETGDKKMEDRIDKIAREANRVAGENEKVILMVTIGVSGHEDGWKDMMRAFSKKDEEMEIDFADTVLEELEGIDDDYDEESEAFDKRHQSEEDDDEGDWAADLRPVVSGVVKKDSEYYRRLAEGRFARTQESDINDRELREYLAEKLRQDGIKMKKSSDFKTPEEYDDYLGDLMEKYIVRK